MPAPFKLAHIGEKPFHCDGIFGLDSCLYEPMVLTSSVCMWLTVCRPSSICIPLAVTIYTTVVTRKTYVAKRVSACLLSMGRTIIWNVRPDSCMFVQYVQQFFSQEPYIFLVRFLGHLYLYIRLHIVPIFRIWNINLKFSKTSYDNLSVSALTVEICAQLSNALS